MATEPPAVPERLVHPKACRDCGRAIPPGTLLSALAWDPGARAWSHAQHSCAELEGPGGPDGPSDRSAPTSEAPETQGTHGVAVARGNLPRGPERGSWSVTVEFHDAEDPAQSKRVVRIARLHRGTYEEAKETLRQLRGWPCGGPVGG